MDYPPDSPASRRKPDALQKFYYHYPPPTYPDPIYHLDRSPGPYVHPDSTYEDAQRFDRRHDEENRPPPITSPRGSHRRSDITISHLRARNANDPAQSHPMYEYNPVPTRYSSPKHLKVTPPSTSARTSNRMPLASIPFFENLNTPSPPRRADHLINRKTRFEREMDTLALEDQTKKERSPSVIKKASALEGVDLDDKYVGPWVLGKVVGKGASGEFNHNQSASCCTKPYCFICRSRPIGQITMVSSLRSDQNRT